MCLYVAYFTVITIINYMNKACLEDMGAFDGITHIIGTFIVFLIGLIILDAASKIPALICKAFKKADKEWEEMHKDD